MVEVASVAAARRSERHVLNTDERPASGTAGVNRGSTELICCAKRETITITDEHQLSFCTGVRRFHFEISSR